MSILIFIISLAVLILVHEFGHFIVAKKSGIRVDEFGIGLPPRIWGKKIGETIYSVNWIPFGGFVKIFGEDSDPDDLSEPKNDSPGQVSNMSASDEARSMHKKPKWIQASVLLAGVTFNIIFAWILISAGFIIGQPSPVEQSPFGRVEDAKVTITSVLRGSPAEKAGLLSGDVIVAISNEQRHVGGPDLSPDEVSAVIAESKKEVVLHIDRGAKEKIVSVLPADNIVSDRPAIGVSMDLIGILKLPIHLALLEGARTTWFLIENTVVGLGHFLWGAVHFKTDFSQVTGPVGLAGVVGQASSLGFVYLLSLIALISINLAVINLVPFPALDGGRLLLVAIEAVIRRPIKPAVVRWVNGVGFAILLILMAVITVHDVLKLF